MHHVLQVEVIFIQIVRMPFQISYNHLGYDELLDHLGYAKLLNNWPIEIMTFIYRETLTCRLLNESFCYASLHIGDLSGSFYFDVRCKLNSSQL